MNAEELIKYLKKCIDDLDIQDFEAIITPTKYDPTQLQNDVSFIIMENVKEGSIPRFHINVKDLVAIRNWNVLRGRKAN